MLVNSGQYKGRKLLTLSGEHTRPTTAKVREAVFSSLQSIVPGCVWLDLFAGSGGMGIEALSRGAEFCYFVDNNARAAKIIQQNISCLNIPSNRAELLRMDAVQACKKIEQQTGKSIDIAYLDPPFGDEDKYQRAITAVLRVLKGQGWLVVEHAKGFIPPVPEHYRWKNRTYGQTAVSYYRGWKGEPQ